MKKILIEKKEIKIIPWDADTVFTRVYCGLGRYFRNVLTRKESPNPYDPYQYLIKLFISTFPYVEKCTELKNEEHTKYHVESMHSLLYALL
ncbi:hypothetical protein, partial [Zooshikella harenae]